MIPVKIEKSPKNEKKVAINPSPKILDDQSKQTLIEERILIVKKSKSDSQKPKRRKPFAKKAKPGSESSEEESTSSSLSGSRVNQAFEDLMNENSSSFSRPASSFSRPSSRLSSSISRMSSYHQPYYFNGKQSFQTISISIQ